MFQRCLLALLPQASGTIIRVAARPVTFPDKRSGAQVTKYMHQYTLEDNATYVLQWQPSDLPQFRSGEAVTFTYELKQSHSKFGKNNTELVIVKDSIIPTVPESSSGSSGGPAVAAAAAPRRPSFTPSPPSPAPYPPPGLIPQSSAPAPSPQESSPAASAEDVEMRRRMQAVEAAVQLVSRLDSPEFLPEKIVTVAKKVLHFASTGEFPKDFLSEPAVDAAAAAASSPSPASPSSCTTSSPSASCSTSSSSSASEACPLTPPPLTPPSLH